MLPVCRRGRRTRADRPEAVRQPDVTVEPGSKARFELTNWIRLWSSTLTVATMLPDLLDDYLARHPDERAIVRRFTDLLSRHPNCFHRDCWAGHITASAWIVDPVGEQVLLTHHRKLDRWLQPGGHSDGDPDSLAVALREAEEETGLDVRPVSRALFDIDIHPIPERGPEPEHAHFDVRFALISRDTGYTVSDESHDLAWVPLTRLRDYTDEESVLRMARKWRARDRLDQFLSE